MSRSPLKKNAVCCTDIIMLIVFVAFWAGMVRFCSSNYEGSLREGHGGRGEEGRKERGQVEGSSRSPLKKNAVCCTDIIMLIVFVAFWAGMVRFCFINYEGSLGEDHGGRVERVVERGEGVWGEVLNLHCDCQGGRGKS